MMLVDTPVHLQYLHGHDPLLREIARITSPDITDEALDSPPRLGQGIYLGFINSRIGLKSTIKSEWPFMDDYRRHIDENKNRLDAGLAPVPWDWENNPDDFGVCDDPQQILDKWPSLETDPRHFQIWLAEVRREHQSPEGGWRWHKWGPYIGTYEPKHEYLYDEDIERVLTFSIIEVDF